MESGTDSDNDQPAFRPAKASRTTTYTPKDMQILLLNGVWQARCPSSRHTSHIRLAEFVPAPCTKHHRRRHCFLKALEALPDNEHADNTALLKDINKYRMKMCAQCRSYATKSQNKLTTKAGACKQKYAELQAFAEDVGCCLCGCNDATQYDHMDTTTKMRDAKGVPVDISNFGRWTTLGGPVAMEFEAKTLCRVLCCNCHAMQETHNVFRGASSSDYEDVSAAVDFKRYQQKRVRKIIEDKQQYVNALKLKIGECAECALVVVPRDQTWTPGVSGHPHVFQFAHKDERIWSHRVAALVASRRIFETERPLIDTEIGKCRLLCGCCHQVETARRFSVPAV